MTTAWTRSVRRTPWYALGTILVVALGTALSTTVFAVVDGVLFKALPYPNAHQLYLVGRGAYVPSDIDRDRWAAAVPEARTAAFTMTFDAGSVGDVRPVALRAAAVSVEFFEVLGVAPMLGGLTAGQFEPSTGPMPALLTYGLWQRQFGGALDVIGRRLQVAGPTRWDGRAAAGVEVAGVLPPTFAFPHNDWAPDLLVPFALTREERQDRVASAAFALFRVPDALPGPTIEARVRAVPLDSISTGTETGRDAVRVSSLGEAMQWLGRSDRTAFGAAALIVLLAAANAAGLELARRRQRHREYAVRRALGADTSSLVRLAVRESAPLVVVGAASGIAVVPALLGTSVALLPTGMQFIKPPTLDARVAVFAVVQAGVVLLTAVLGHLRASTPPDLAGALGGAHVTPSRWHRLAGAGIVVQVGLAFVLTTAGTLASASLWRLTSEHPGFDVDRTLLVDVSTASRPRPARLAWLRQLAEDLRGLPDVEAVGIAGTPPFAGMARMAGIQRPADALPGREQLVPAADDLFRALDIAPLRGRLPTVDELAAGAPVAVVSEQAARSLWPHCEAVGQTLVSSSGAPSWTVIGVVADTQYSALGQKRFSQIYRPFDGGGTTATLVVRAARAPAGVLAGIAARLQRPGDPDALLRATTSRDAMRDTIRYQRFQGWFFGSFAAVALLITTIGVLALVAMSTVQRTRELGVRAALGADTASLVWTCARGSFALVLAGLAAGGVVSAWAVALLRGFLFEVDPLDPQLWSLAAASVLAATAAGALIPAVRAGRADPTIALRAE